MTLNEFYDLTEEEADKQFSAFINQFYDNKTYLVRIEKYISGRRRVLFEVMHTDCYEFIDRAIRGEDCKNGVMVDGNKMVIVGSNWYYPDGKFGDTNTVTYEFKETDLEDLWQKKIFC